MDNKKTLIALIGALMVGSILDKVLTYSYIGLGLSLTLAIFTILFFILYGSIEKLKRKKELLLIIPVFIIIFHNCVYTNPVLFTLNLFILPALIAWIHLIYTWDDIEFYNPLFLLEPFFQILITPLTLISIPFKKYREMFKNLFFDRKFKFRPEIFYGVVVSIPILIVVLILLTSSDVVFSYYVSNTLEYFNIFKDLNINEAIGHSILIFIIVLWVLAYMLSFESITPIIKYTSQGKTLHHLTINIPVTLLNIIYVLFSIIQFSYLYSGGNLPNGYNYAAYARKGFFELISVAIINFIIILIGLNKSIKSDKKQNIYTNILYSFLIIFTLNMLYSAHFKMNLYETTYGYTYLRVFVQLFMLLLLIISIIILLAVWYNNFNLSKAIILTSIIFYSLINTLNIDGMIAKENTALYKTKNKIDTSYITALSYEAIPYIIELENINDPLLKHNIEFSLHKFKNNLANDNSILNFNYSKEKAKRLLLK